MLERLIERKLVAWAKKKGVLTYKFSSPANRGVPDRIFMRDGLILFLELKAEGKKPTKLQLRHLRKIQSQGVDADWAAGYQSAVEYLETYFF